MDAGNIQDQVHCNVFTCNACSAVHELLVLFHMKLYVKPLALMLQVVLFFVSRLKTLQNNNILIKSTTYNFFSLSYQLKLQQVHGKMWDGI